MQWIALQPTPDDTLADALADAHAAWGWWALQFTPLVARVESALLLEVSGSVRLFGGGDALLESLFKPNWPIAPARSKVKCNTP